jgi:hypothetical protein
MGLVVVVKGKLQDAGAPRYRCECCPERTPFWDGEERAFERHVVACAAEHDEQLRALSLREQMPAILDPQRSGDTEFERWIRAHRDALLKGRKKP